MTGLRTIFRTHFGIGQIITSNGQMKAQRCDTGLAASVTLLLARMTWC